MCRALIIGAGGVGTVVAQKVAANPVFTDIMLASRTKSKCDAVAAAIGGNRVKTAQVDADSVEELVALFNEFKPDIVINEVIEILSPLSNNKKISVEYDNKFEFKIQADYQKFRQILYNLLSNAIKFTRENGQIIVRTYEKNDKFYLEVQDNGVGIDKKYHKKIFTKFVHFSNIYAKNESSTGLGLTITKELVKLHKGKITFTSELDKGTTFVVELGGIIK